ncbi:MAG: polysaccharide biosynthesis C-terminal domain-containing protein [Tissierellia bacterium]|nr:polysaccharide biosynthesis C-terminal domain-containing protein [Tissierellia bacterium]MDD4779633.1 polysaccharide biosynthesis C-terminal domain-containing protein [Tissierellia bacterium]
MNKYKKLITNTIIFGIGTFGSKVLVFLLMPLYTRVLSSTDYGVVDLIIQTSNLLIPIVSLGIANGVIRFGLDRSIRKSEVFSVGLAVILTGFAIFLIFIPIVSKITYISGRTALIYLFVLMSALRTLCSQFVRSKEYVRLYAFDGLLSTFTTIVFNVLLLVVFKLGITGYILAIVISDLLSTVFLFSAAKLKRYVHLNHINKDLARAMVRYSLPLIPSTIFWWMTNVSNRFIVAHVLGNEANGLFAVSYKIPTIIVLISNIFMDAWQMSAVSEEDKRSRAKFFSKVFNVYQSILFLSASCIILFSKFITKILVSESFYLSWKYIPILVMATTFSCLVTFLGSVYMVEKKSYLTLSTTVVGAVTNVVLTFLLIDKFGVNGAAFATFISYFTVFLIRAKNTSNFITIKWNVPKLVINTIIVLCQSIIMIFEVKYWIIYEIILVSLMMLINFSLIWNNVKKLIKK